MLELRFGMRVLAAIFFIIFFPVVVLAFTFIYKGVSANDLKQQMVKANIYGKITDIFIDSVAKSDNENTRDFSTALVVSILQKKLTPEYVQGKTEKLIDDSGLWITGKTQAPPVISFKDIKDQITLQYPSLIPALTATIAQARQAGGNTNQLTTLQTIISGDFTIPMEKSLLPLKDFYKTVTIALPVLIILLMLCLLIIVTATKGIAMRIRWTGAVLILAGLYGFLILALNGIIFSWTTQVLIANQNDVITTLSPILLGIFTEFTSRFIHYQTTTNIIVLLSGILFFVISLFYKPKKITS